MKQYYWQSKEEGYMIPETFLFDDAMLNSYYDITDPCSSDYLNFNLYYTKTNKVVR